MISRSLALFALLISAVSPAGARQAVRYTAGDFNAWAACAVQKNNDEIVWMHALATGQSGIGKTTNPALASLSGAALLGARTYAAIIVARDCAPTEVRMDNEYFDKLARAVEARWTPSFENRSSPRAVDAWADCVVAKYGQLASLYLAANDLSVAGMPMTSSGIDPHKAIFNETPACNSLRGAAQPVDYLGIYARINFRTRVSPLLSASSVPGDRAAAEGSH